MSEQVKKPTQVTTGLVRFSYANVINPKADDNGEMKYSVCILIPKAEKATLTAIKLAIDAAKEEGKAKLGGKIPAGLKIPIRDGDAEKEDDENYKGMYFLNAKSKSKPDVINSKKVRLTEDEFYSGCWGRANINFYAFATKGNRGIAAGLNAILKVKDGERLAGRPSAEDVFGEFLEDGDFSDKPDDAEDFNFG